MSDTRRRDPERTPRVVRAPWIAGFGIGTATHVLDLALGIAVILADIAVNWTVITTTGGIPVWGAVNQTLFAILVLATAPALLRWWGPEAARG
ncbi:hypothetical protein [Clavibacter sp. Sh2088]|uniref:hypothetical protein n=1 Tax=Clavibacter sp. Sh2088 TaxID=3397676 RepID=UPI0039DFED05